MRKDRRDRDDGRWRGGEEGMKRDTVTGGGRERGGEKEKGKEERETYPASFCLSKQTQRQEEQ